MASARSGRVVAEETSTARRPLPMDCFIDVVDGDRPYATPGMTTERWQLVPPTTVLVEDLVTTQEAVSIDGLQRAFAGLSSFCGDIYPHVVRFAGRHWLQDGHHRVVRAVLDRQHLVHARVIAGVATADTARAPWRST